jgi:hypothetical protein
MSDSTPTLLLTSCVYPSAPFVELADPTERIELTLESIRQWIKIARNLNIVICDGSGYDFTQSVAERFPGAKIECINFKNDAEAVLKFGKGYGEGEIVEYALENSEYLRRSDYFLKCTSKLWVKNLPEILKHWNGIFQCQFGLEKPKTIKSAKPSSVDTRFYIVKKRYYIDYFLHAYKNVNDHGGYYLEHTFRDVILDNRLRASSILFPIPPLIEGVAGTTGETYKAGNPINKRFKNFKTYVKLRLNERFFRPAL